MGSRLQHSAGLAVSWILTIIGVVCVLLGVALVNVPAALIVGGVLGILVGAFLIDADQPTQIEEPEDEEPPA